MTIYCVNCSHPLPMTGPCPVCRKIEAKAREESTRYDAQKAYEVVRVAFPGSMGGYGPWSTLGEWQREHMVREWKDYDRYGRKQ